MLCSCCLYLIIVICTIASVIGSKAALETAFDHTGKIPNLNQIFDDWAVIPYIDIQVVKNDTDCPTGYEDVFVRVWPGTEVGCLFGDAVEPTPDEDDDGDTCADKIEETYPVFQNSFYAKKICGIKGGLPFSNVTRPDPTTKECPEGTQPCSSKTKTDNTICYPPD